VSEAGSAEETAAYTTRAICESWNVTRGRSFREESIAGDRALARERAQRARGESAQPIHLASEEIERGWEEMSIASTFGFRSSVG